MGTVITTGAHVITPTQVLGYESTREAGAILHPILARAEVDVTLRPAALRTGRLELGFAGPTSEADSATAEAVLSGAAVFDLLTDERDTVAMRFVIPRGGRINRALEPVTRDAWVVTFDWHEVAP